MAFGPWDLSSQPRLVVSPRTEIRTPLGDGLYRIKYDHTLWSADFFVVLSL